PSHDHFGLPLDQLIATVLSQHTNDANSGRAFRELKRRFPRWELAAAAQPADIKDAIRTAGLAGAKSRSILRILAQVKADWGRYSLAKLKTQPPKDARQYLLSLPGVGPKTAACTLLFSFGMPVFPVDTHILRVTKRLGLLPPGATAEQAHDLLGQAAPHELCYPLHILIIWHGRRVCRARKPECGRCVLSDRCPSKQ
ncbi:MAG TPA: endonuclease III, partial [Candidatus Brocadiia bacterium]|nr:endonuclease III [Candidatus Brocadiia bacterium]